MQELEQIVQEMMNAGYSKEKIELFAVNSEIVQSSK